MLPEPSKPGVQLCMKCGWKFISPDPERIRRCQDCKKHEELYEPPSGRLVLTEGIVHILWEFQQ